MRNLKANLLTNAPAPEEVEETGQGKTKAEDPDVYILHWGVHEDELPKKQETKEEK